jgi:Protein of unknown function (DUF4233)
VSSTPPSPAAQPVAPRGLFAVGSAGLGIEALVLLLAVPAVISAQRGHVSVAGVSYLAALAVMLVLAAARLRKPGGKVLATVIQLLVVAGGVVTWPMYVVGAAFAAIWAYWLAQWPRGAECPRLR